MNRRGRDSTARYAVRGIVPELICDLVEIILEMPENAEHSVILQVPCSLLRQRSVGTRMSTQQRGALSVPYAGKATNS